MVLKESGVVLRQRQQLWAAQSELFNLSAIVGEVDDAEREQPYLLQCALGKKNFRNRIQLSEQTERILSLVAYRSLFDCFPKD